MNPLVSILMPAYNAGKFISDAIESCQVQTSRDWELLIVDDGSVDGTAAVAEGYAAADDRVRVQRAEHRGVGAALNTAFAMSKGEIVCRLDADDAQDPWRLKCQMSILHRYPRKRGPQMTSCMTQSMDANGTVLDVCGLSQERKTGHAVVGGAPLMFWREVNESIGGWDESLVVGEDTDWTFRAQLAGFWASCTPLRLYYVRKHPDKLTIRHRAQYLQTLKDLHAKYLGDGIGITNDGNGRIIYAREMVGGPQ